MKNLLAFSLVTFTVLTTNAWADAASSADGQTQNEFLPPDFFLAPGQTGESYVFPTKLEVPCSPGSSKLCPNYGTDGMPTDWVLARYKSRHAGGFDCSTSSLLMVYIPPGSPVKGKADRVHRWLNFALPTDTHQVEPCLRKYSEDLVMEADEDPTAIVPPTPTSPIPASYTSEMPSTFTMVSLTEGEPAKVHFQKFMRGFDSNFFTPVERDPVTFCHSCHPNGLRAISPLGYHVDATEAANPQTMMLEEANWKAVKKINDAMERAEGGVAVKWDQDFDPSTNTNIIGPSTPKNPKTRTKEYILGNGTTEPGCAKIKTTYDMKDIFGRIAGRKNVYTMSPDANLDWEKIRDAMNCESCHDNTQRGAINDSVDFSQINFKILVDQSMPQGSLKDPYSSAIDRSYSNTLDIDHRIALANCLRKELEDTAN